MAASVGYAAATFALEIDGTFAGFLSSFDGGDAFAEVTEAPGAGGPMDKSIGSAQYDDIVVTCPFPDGTLATWVSAFLEGKAAVHDGAVTALNINRQPVRRLEWHKGAIFSVAFPALDATQGRQASEMTIAIRPTTTRDGGGTGQVPTAPQTKRMASSMGSFTLSIPGIDCTRVVRIEPVVATQTYVAPSSGRGAPEPGPVRVSDLVVTVQQSGASDFLRWAEDFIVTGNNTKAHEKDATVRYLAPNLRDEVGTLDVLSTGIFRVDHESQTVGVTTTARVRLSMYVEQVQWAKAVEQSVPSATPTAQPSTGGDVRDVLGMRLSAADVIRRLREAPASEQRPDGVDSQRRLGREVGLAWAQRHASLAELREVAAADGQDWSSLSLPAGHSLAETVTATLDVPLLYDGRLDLPRDALAEGVISGVLEALAELNEQLDV